MSGGTAILILQMFARRVVLILAVCAGAAIQVTWRRAPSWQPPMGAAHASQTTMPASDACNRPVVGAYYYMWYNREQWDRDQTRYEPLLGRYNSGPLAVQQHSAWARQAAIDFFLISWVDRNHDEVKAYLSVPNALPIALHIETQMIFDNYGFDGRLVFTAQRTNILLTKRRALERFCPTI